MKKNVLFPVLLCLSAGISHSATISGTVSSVSACSVVAGQKIFVRDSLGTYSDSAVTNSSGVYSITIPASLSTPNALSVSTMGCGVKSEYFNWYTGSSMVQDFIICGYRSRVAGVVKVGSRMFNIKVMVYLINKEYDPVLMDTTLTAIDSVVAGPSFATYEFNRLCPPKGIWLVKAALLPTDSNYALYLPSYYVSATSSSLSWSTATGIKSSGPVDIVMIAGSNPGGPGFIGGSVLLGANKSTAVGDPLNRRILLLTTAAGQAVAYTYSDANGMFQFPGLAYGTYHIFGDALGKTNPAFTVTISAANTSVRNIIFEENNKTFKGSLNLNAGSINGLAAISIFPNPAADFVYVDGLASLNGNKTLILSDVTGAVISRQAVTQGADGRIATQGLSAGIYLLQVQTEAGNASFRIIR